MIGFVARDLRELREKGEEMAAAFLGVYTGLVTDNRDPDKLARVKVRVPAVAEKRELWARFTTPMAGPRSGVLLTPAVGDEVLVAFERGNIRNPIVLGGLWNAKAPPPETINPRDGLLTIRSRHGMAVTIVDGDDADVMVVETPRGQRITLDDGSDTIRIEGPDGNTVVLSSSGVDVTATARVRIQASMLEISAALLQVEAAMAKFSGVVKCETLISNSVVGGSYTPGAANIW